MKSYSAKTVRILVGIIVLLVIALGGLYCKSTRFVGTRYSDEKYGYTDEYVKIEKFKKAIEWSKLFNRHEFRCPFCNGDGYWTEVEEEEEMHAACDGCGYSLVTRPKD